MNRQTNDYASKHWLIEQIEKNLFAIIAGVAFVWTTSQTADAVTAKDMRAIEKRLDSIDAKLVDRRGFMGCAIRTLDKVTEKTGVNPPCDLLLPEN